MRVKKRYLKKLRTFIGKMDLELERVNSGFYRIYYLPKGRDRKYIGGYNSYYYNYFVAHNSGRSGKFVFDLLLKVGLKDKIERL